MYQSINLGENELWRDAWGRPKFYQDRSLFSSLFLSSIDGDRWAELIDGVEQPSLSNATSDNGKLILTSTVLNQRVTVKSTRNPRYRPNRGQLYSTSMLIPSADLNAIHRFGLFNDDSGVFFELNNGVWYGVLRTTVDGVTVDTKKKFLLDTSPKRQDATKGNVFDIQYQWRGVGNYKFFMNLDKCCEFTNLGSNTDLTIFNPAIPAAYEVEKISGDTPILQSGCVDVSSEGGDKLDLKFGSVGVETISGEVSITGENAPIIAIRAKKTITGTSGTILNTRDSKVISFNGYGDNKGIVRLWKTRAGYDTAITIGTQSWTDYGDGRLEYIILDPTETTPMTFNSALAQPLVAGRFAANETVAVDVFNTPQSDLFITAGDLLVVTANRDNGAGMSAGASIQFGEEV